MGTGLRKNTKTCASINSGLSVAACSSPRVNNTHKQQYCTHKTPLSLRSPMELATPVALFNSRDSVWSVQMTTICLDNIKRPRRYLPGQEKQTIRPRPYSKTLDKRGRAPASYLPTYVKTSSISGRRRQIEGCLSFCIANHVSRISQNLSL